MDTVRHILLEQPEGKAVIVTFSDGEELELKNFDPVDESVYDRPDLISATLVRAISCRKTKTINEGSMIDFSVSEAKRVVDPENTRVLFELD